MTILSGGTAADVALLVIQVAFGVAVGIGMWALNTWLSGEKLTGKGLADAALNSFIVCSFFAFVNAGVNYIKSVARGTSLPQKAMNKVANTDNPLKDVKYSDEVLRKMSANDNHNFPAIVDNYGAYGKATVAYGADGSLYTYVNIDGFYRGNAGVFEYIINDSNTLTHRFFRVIK